MLFFVVWWESIEVCVGSADRRNALNRIGKLFGAIYWNSFTTQSFQNVLTEQRLYAYGNTDAKLFKIKFYTVHEAARLLTEPRFGSEFVAISRQRDV